MAVRRAVLAGPQPEDSEANRVYSDVPMIPPQYDGSSSARGVVLIRTRKGS